MMGEVPDSCLNDDHDYDQTGRCTGCGTDRVSATDSWGNRRTGGAGVLTQPLSNEDYRRRRRKLEEMAGKR